MFCGKKCKTDFVSLTELQKSSYAFNDGLHLFDLSLNPKFNTEKSRFKEPYIDLRKFYIANLKNGSRKNISYIGEFSSSDLS